MAEPTIAPEPCSAQEKSLPSGQLKVREGYYDYQHHRASRSKPYQAPVPVPWVQIKGYWLNKAGFPIGTAISVEVSNGCLIFKTIPNSSSR